MVGRHTPLHSGSTRGVEFLERYASYSSVISKLIKAKEGVDFDLAILISRVERRGSAQLEVCLTTT
jgi:hypothetical protein